MYWRWILLAGGGLGGACGAAPGVQQTPELAGDLCQVTFAGAPLPREVRETSGLAESGKQPGVFWTHNDGKKPELFAVRSDGTVSGRVRVAGVKLRDWEDLGVGPCGSGTCLYLADTGDNGGERSDVTIVEVPEPALTAGTASASRVVQLRYPDGAHDAEAVFRMPGGDLFIVTKGRHGAVELYRVPRDTGGDVRMLERIRELAPQPSDPLDWVTGGAASPDGKWVAVRSYRELRFYRADDLLGDGTAQPVVVDLTPLGERQGESVAFARDGSVWLSSESENPLHPPTWSRLVCELP